MTFNTELANRTLDYIREHPNEWNQIDWRKCFAGIALKLQGFTINLTAAVYDSDGKYLGGVRTVASQELGFDYYWDTANLFSHSNTLEDLERIIQSLGDTEMENQ